MNPQRRAPRRRLWQTLVWLGLAYAAVLWWMGRVVRWPLSLDYFQNYVVLQCSSRYTANLPPAPSREVLVEVEKGLRGCQGMRVDVDGVWGGVLGRIAVRLKVVPADGGEPELKYYSVDVNPLIGLPSISYELTPLLYYLNP